MNVTWDRKSLLAKDKCYTRERCGAAFMYIHTNVASEMEGQYSLKKATGPKRILTLSTADTNDILMIEKDLVKTSGSWQE